MKKQLYIFIILSFLSCENSKSNHPSGENVTTDTLVQVVPKYKKTEINYDKQDTLTKVGEPFVINGIKCYWKLTFMVYEGAESGEGTLELKNQNTQKTLLSNADYYSFEDSYYTHSFNNIHFESLNMDYVEDLNFDGYKDFKLFDKTASGSAGMFYRAYIFNSRKKIFELSEELSGYELAANKTEKTLSTYAKSGYGWNTSSTHHFSKNGEIKFTETQTKEVISGDSTELLKTTYEKIKNGKVVETKIDTTQFEGW